MILMVMSLGIIANVIAVKFWSDAQEKLSVVESRARGYRAQLLAGAGFYASIQALKTVPEEYLFSSGLALNPPDLPVEDCKPACFISYRLQPEDGKFNLNYLVQSFDQEPSEHYRAALERLFVYYSLPVDGVDSIIDWIDTNNFSVGRGGESSYYSSLTPPRKIKDGPLYSLSEIGLIKDINYQDFLSSRAPEKWKEEREDLSFLTEDEKNLITDDDWIPANNLTAYVTDDENRDDRININAARYHVLMSLSDSMTDEAVLALYKLRRENGYYLKELTPLKELPEFQALTPLGVSLYEELAGGGEKTGLLKTEGRVYRIMGIGSIMPPGSDSRNIVVRKMTGLYDVKEKKLLYYSED